LRVGDFFLLIAAALASIITSAAATPFEMLRVRSMAYVEPKPWKSVLAAFLVSDVVTAAPHSE